MNHPLDLKMTEAYLSFIQHLLLLTEDKDFGPDMLDNHNVLEVLVVLMESPNKGVALKAGSALDFLASRNTHLRRFILERKNTLDILIKMCGKESNSVSEAMVALLVRVIGCLAGMWPLNVKHVRILQCPQDEFDYLTSFCDRWRTKKQDCVGKCYLSNCN